MDGWTDERIEGRKDRRTSRYSRLCPTGHWPSGAAAQKGYDRKKAWRKNIAAKIKIGKVLKLYHESIAKKKCRLSDNSKDYLDDNGKYHYDDDDDKN